MSTTRLNFVDRLIVQADRAVRTLAGSPDLVAERPTPAQQMPDNEMTASEKQHAAALMRVNHSGEVCAQALYQGQALTARLPDVRAEMEHAAMEEIDHLVWCQQRIDELGSHTSYLNPVWYGLSFMIGAGAGLISDKVSLGFVAATENQVCRHLQDHLTRLPLQDLKSRAVIEQMLEDEARHAETALSAGGYRFPFPVRQAMTLVSKAMTATSYRI